MRVAKTLELHQTEDLIVHRLMSTRYGGLIVEYADIATLARLRDVHVDMTIVGAVVRRRRLNFERL